MPICVQNWIRPILTDGRTFVAAGEGNEDTSRVLNATLTSYLNGLFPNRRCHALVLVVDQVCKRCRATLLGVADGKQN